jgi:hypothetical protein
MKPRCDGGSMRSVALSTTDAFSGTDFSLCGFFLAD